MHIVRWILVFIVIIPITYGGFNPSCYNEEVCDEYGFKWDCSGTPCNLLCENDHPRYGGFVNHVSTEDVFLVGDTVRYTCDGTESVEADYEIYAGERFNSNGRLYHNKTFEYHASFTCEFSGQTWDFSIATVHDMNSAYFGDGTRIDTTPYQMRWVGETDWHDCGDQSYFVNDLPQLAMNNEEYIINLPLMNISNNNIRQSTERGFEPNNALALLNYYNSDYPLTYASQQELINLTCQFIPFIDDQSICRYLPQNTANVSNTIRNKLPECTVHSIYCSNPSSSDESCTLGSPYNIKEDFWNAINWHFQNTKMPIYMRQATTWYYGDTLSNSFTGTHYAKLLLGAENNVTFWTFDGDRLLVNNSYSIQYRDVKNNWEENNFDGFYLTCDICGGTVQVITEDANSNPMQDLIVTKNGGYNKTTDIVGAAQYNINYQTCGETSNYTVYCSDGNTFCDSQIAGLGTTNDYKGLLFDCTICNGEPDLKIGIGDISVNKNGDSVSVDISTLNVPTTSNVNITFKVQDDEGLVTQYSQLFNVNSRDTSEQISKSIDFDDHDEFVHVYVDTTNKVIESNEKNNYVLAPIFEPEITAYINVSTGYPLVDDVIKDYLKLYVIEKPQNEAEVTIAVGLPKKSEIISGKNYFTRANFNWWTDDYGIHYNGDFLGSKPCNALVGSFSVGQNYIFVTGDDIDGVLAGVKRLVSARSLFLNKQTLGKQRTSAIGDLDIAGISVTDLLRNPSNFAHYYQRNTDAFANVVERILTNNNFEIAIKTVKTLNTTSYEQSTILRLKSLNTDFSEDYKGTVVGNDKPVVFSGGIFSNLVTWEGVSTYNAENGQQYITRNGLAKELADEGYDVWEIEMNGGENTECSTCPDYTYQDQVDYFWPALIVGVMNYSGSEEINYIGHSNGCRVALSSLNSYSDGEDNVGYVFNTETGQYDILVDLPNHPVDKFFGVACPATLNEGTRFTEAAREPRGIGGQARGDYAIDELNKSNDTHIKQGDYAKLTNPIRGRIADISFFGDSKISLNLMNFYNDLAINENSVFELTNVQVDFLGLFYGTRDYLRPISNGEHDGIVPLSDGLYIFYNLSSIGYLKPVSETHTGFYQDYIVKEKIIEGLQ